ncbi:AfsR/SARP family transcriptional regulator [Streptomyces sp. RTd22]|uniref:AfsR/SARP family transcriptional regulator n=1 Tax=Streptomyces sp. RTd22 TaxID=1841249 RepID=UPI0007C47AD3|nr:AfsR/SARP family transcriptional regulator [Streptomyces sp. RTd22]
MIANVLGPLRVTLNGGSVVPAAPKARKVLALLVLNRGRVVQIDAMEREVWGAAAPKSAATSLQNYVMQIRKHLGMVLPGGPGSALAKQVLVTEQTGYRLAVPDDEFDVRRYQDLVAEAGRAEEAGQLAQASALLRCALDLWRDEPLADLPTGPVLQSHVLRLEEDRKSVLRRRILLDLRLQRYEVVGELRALTALHPYDEMLHECLMIALNRSGRRNDALSVYQGLRSALAEGIGLEPSMRLQELQKSILVAGGSLTPALPSVGL